MGTRLFPTQAELGWGTRRKIQQSEKVVQLSPTQAELAWGTQRLFIHRLRMMCVYVFDIFFNR